MPDNSIPQPLPIPTMSDADRAMLHLSEQLATFRTRAYPYPGRPNHADATWLVIYQLACAVVDQQERIAELERMLMPTDSGK